MKTRREVVDDLRRWIGTHYGVIGFLEATRLGATKAMIEARRKRGEWARVHRGVFRDTAFPRSPHQDLRAAVVATQGCGVASHASAAWLWELLRDPPPTPELSVPRGLRNVRRGSTVRIHVSSDLNIDLAIEWKAIPVTNPLRTVVDVAGWAPERTLTEVVDSALAKRLVTVVGIEAELERLARRGRPGIKALRRHLAERGFTGAPAPSVLEAHVRRLVRATGLPEPAVEAKVEEGRYRLDVAWILIMLAVEVDGYVWHFSPEFQQRDAARRNRLQAAGWTVLVYTWRDVMHEPARVTREITSTYERLAAAGR